MNIRVFFNRSVIGQLMENRKIATATHNIRAFRLFCTEKQAVIQDCDDDGETHAGGRLLHLLQVLSMHVVFSNIGFISLYFYTDD